MNLIALGTALLAVCFAISLGNPVNQSVPRTLAIVGLVAVAATLIFLGLVGVRITGN